MVDIKDETIEKLTQAINNLSEKIDDSTYLSYDELAELIRKLEEVIDPLVIAIGYLCRSMPVETEKEESS